jgi:chorismate--pyruvate lyase
LREHIPPRLLPWLAEPALLTARMRAACGAAMRLKLLRLEPAPLDPALARRLGTTDHGCLHREIELSCAEQRWIFARSVFPDSTVREHPWLKELGANGLGETLARRSGVEREAPEYRQLPRDDELAQAAAGKAGLARLWARRKLYRLAGRPILVQEVFLPNLHCA